MHGQVTHASSLHSFRMFVTCFLLCWRFCFLFPPNSLSFLSRFPSPLSQDTSVSDTSVSPGQVSLHTNICRCDIKSPLRELLFYIQAYFQVSRLCIAKPRAWKRGCGKVKSPPIPKQSLMDVGTCQGSKPKYIEELEGSGHFLTLRSRSYIGSFSSKFPLISKYIHTCIFVDQCMVHRRPGLGAFSGPEGPKWSSKGVLRRKTRDDAIPKIFALHLWTYKKNSTNFGICTPLQLHCVPPTRSWMWSSC